MRSCMTFTVKLLGRDVNYPPTPRSRAGEMLRPLRREEESRRAQGQPRIMAQGSGSSIHSTSNQRISAPSRVPVRIYPVSCCRGERQPDHVSLGRRAPRNNAKAPLPEGPATNSAGVARATTHCTFALMRSISLSDSASASPSNTPSMLTKCPPDEPPMAPILSGSMP